MLDLMLKWDYYTDLWLSGGHVNDAITAKPGVWNTQIIVTSLIFLPIIE